MLDQQKDIDGVVIATPDHTHAVIAMAAIQAGKHVYCQKPLTHTVYEARMLAQAAREQRWPRRWASRATAWKGIRLICEWVAAGLLGEVREVDAWCSLSYYPWGHAGWSSVVGSARRRRRPCRRRSIGTCGSARRAMRPYHRAYHPQTWRCFWDFGCGMMGDRGAHTLDPVVSALKLRPAD